MNRSREKLIEDLSLMDVEELTALLVQVRERREQRRKEQLAEAFNAFNEAWERMEELGYYATFSFGEDDKTLPLNLIIWREAE